VEVGNTLCDNIYQQAKLLVPASLGIIIGDVRCPLVSSAQLGEGEGRNSEQVENAALKL